eukprot:m.227215 g.227215  ORF g.227215 m.227215 type:complete len:125 (+) comp26413_c0_seq3:204-578(+)
MPTVNDVFEEKWMQYLEFLIASVGFTDDVHNMGLIENYLKTSEDADRCLLRTPLKETSFSTAEDGLNLTPFEPLSNIEQVNVKPIFPSESMNNGKEDFAQTWFVDEAGGGFTLLVLAHIFFSTA